MGGGEEKRVVGGGGWGRNLAPRQPPRRQVIYSVGLLGKGCKAGGAEERLAERVKCVPRGARCSWIASLCIPPPPKRRR